MLFNALTENDKALIEGYIENYAGNDYQNFNYNRRANLEYLLRFWNKNKVDLFRLLGNKFIVSKEVCFSKGSEEMYEEINELLSYRNRNEPFYRFIDNYHNWISTYCSYDDNNYYHLKSLMYIEHLANNEYSGERFSVKTPAGREIIIQPGAKVIRMLGKIAEAFNLENFEEFRQAHSQVFNQKKLTGTLHLSIHPLDYMTMSDNDCGWSSCMNWQETGDYRRGTVEMMNSDMALIAYLSADNDMNIFGSSTWNNKKWRQIFVITPEIITGIKGYPYCNDSLEEEVAYWLRDLAKENLGRTYFEKLVKWSNNRSVENEYFPLGIKVVARSETMYNDCGSHQRALFSPTTPLVYTFNYSGESECMCCGEINYFEEAYELICSECDHSQHRCDECGDRYPEYDLYTVDDCSYCQYCYENYTRECDICGDRHHVDCFEHIHLADSMDQIRVDDYISVCSCCLRYTEGETYLRLREGKEIKVYRLLKTNSNWYSEPIPFVLVDDITKDYLDNNLYGDGQWKTFFDYDDFYNMDNYKVETR